MGILEHARPFHAEGGPVGVLFIHGYLGSPQSVREWAEGTAAAGYTVALPRLPGHGTVWQELNTVSWRDWYDRVDAEYRALQDRCETVFVAGLSMGATLALRLAQHHTDVAGLMLVNPAFYFYEKLAPVAGIVKYLISGVPSHGNDVALEGAAEGAYDWTPASGGHELLRLIADVKPCLDLVTCPVALFRSSVDHTVRPISSDLVTRSISSGDLTVFTLPDSYHVATIDHDRQTIFRESLAFMERVTREAH